jgi:hypothetical protein
MQVQPIEVERRGLANYKKVKEVCDLSQSHIVDVRSERGLMESSMRLLTIALETKLL